MQVTMKKWWREYKKLWTWEYIKKSLTSWEYWKKNFFLKLWENLKEDILKKVLTIILALIIYWFGFGGD